MGWSTMQWVLIYCSPECVADYPASDNEDRNALIETILQTSSLSKAEVAAKFGMTRQAVSKSMRERDPRMRSEDAA